MLTRAIVLFLVSAATLAASADYGCNKPLTVGLTPFGVVYYHEAHGRAAGIEPDLLAELERRTGCHFVIKDLSRPLMLSMVRHGDVQIAGSMAEMPERKTYMDFMLYAQSRNNFVVLKSWAGNLRELNDVYKQPDLVLGVVRDSRYGEPYDAMVAQLRVLGRVREASDNDALIHLLKIGRVHAMLGHVFQYQRSLDELGMADQVVARHWADETAAVRGGLGFAKKYFDEAQLKRWHALFLAMHRDGSIAKLFGRYLDVETVASIALPN